MLINFDHKDKAIFNFDKVSKLKGLRSSGKLLKKEKK